MVNKSRVRKRQIGVRMPPDLMEAVEDRCGRLHISHSALAVAALRKYLGVAAPVDLAAVDDRREDAA